MVGRFRVDLVELLSVMGLAAVAAVSVFVWSQPRPPDRPWETAEFTWLENTYGPARYSEYFEEWIIRDFFNDRRDGVFVDVGAADYRRGSNTYYLETTLGWSGLAVDAQPDYAPGYQQHRPRTTFIPAFVSDRTGETARLLLSQFRPEVASAADRFTERWGALAGSKDVPTFTLNDLLEANKVQAVTFLNMDIELYEPKALAGFDIARYKPELVCVEAHPEVRQEILEYFHANGYLIVGKYLRVDTSNLYFMRRGATVKPFPDDVTQEWTAHPRGQ